MPSTVQTDAVLAALQARGHATNLELHADLAKTLPHLALPSVHRITARLLERRAIGMGPTDGRNVVLDARTTPHDHFVCTSCGGIVDLELPDGVISGIQSQLGKNLVRGSITIRGCCESCASPHEGGRTRGLPDHEKEKE